MSQLSVSFTDGPNVGISYTHFPDGSVYTTNSSAKVFAKDLGSGFTYTDDGLGRILDIATPWDAIDSATLEQYGYDAGGRLTGSSNGVVSTSYGYDTLDRLTGLTNQYAEEGGAGSVVLSAFGGFTYDEQDQRTGETALIPGWPLDDKPTKSAASRVLTYGYDSREELASETSAPPPGATTYTIQTINGIEVITPNPQSVNVVPPYSSIFDYDAVGNFTNPVSTTDPISVNSAVNSDNELTSFGYDDNGSPVTSALAPLVALGLGSSSASLSFDPESRLTSAQEGDGTSLLKSGYFDNGLRAWSAGPNGNTTFYLYDEGGVSGNVPLAEFDASGDTLAINLVGPDGWRQRCYPGSLDVSQGLLNAAPAPMDTLPYLACG